MKTGPLANRDYRFLLGGFALGQMLMPLQFLTQILWVQAHAAQDIWLLLVAGIGASRGLGALIFGLYGGALADAFDRRHLLIVTQALLVIATLSIAAFMHMDIGTTAGFALFFGLTFLSAGLQSIDLPTRLAIVPDILGPALTPAGMSINQVAGQLAMPLAMFSTGFIIHEFGFAGAYLFSVSGHVLVIVLLLMMRYQPLATQHDSRERRGVAQTLRDVRLGIRYARSDRVVSSIILLMVAMMAFGFPATANLGPTWITTVVGVPIRDMGYVVMTWGVGSLIAALGLTYYSDIEHRGRLVAFGALLFAVAFGVFVGAPTVSNAVLGNLGLGAGMTIATVSSTILIQARVSNEVRGRIMSIFQLNMGVAQLMTMPVAFLAQVYTLERLLPALAVITVVVVAAIVLFRRLLLRA